jgi:metal-sulfur cluster biosynthetic enzyme
MAEETPTPKMLWEADSTHPEIAARIREALRQVVDPELGLSIIELGLVRELSIGESEMRLRMILTTPFCPYGPALLEMARAKAQEASGLAAQIDLAPEMWDPSMMEEGAAAAWGFF